VAGAGADGSEACLDGMRPMTRPLRCAAHRSTSSQSAIVGAFGGRKPRNAMPFLSTIVLGEVPDKTSGAATPAFEQLIVKIEPFVRGQTG
jgi:hypothetical protein